MNVAKPSPDAASSFIRSTFQPAARRMIVHLDAAVLESHADPVGRRLVGLDSRVASGISVASHDSVGTFASLPSPLRICPPRCPASTVPAVRGCRLRPTRGQWAALAGVAPGAPLGWGRPASQPARTRERRAARDAPVSIVKEAWDALSSRRSRASRSHHSHRNHDRRSSTPCPRASAAA
jgi:hypothetical protein